MLVSCGIDELVGQAAGDYFLFSGYCKNFMGFLLYWPISEGVRGALLGITGDVLLLDCRSGNGFGGWKELSGGF